jgi:hypothetical protein
VARLLYAAHDPGGALMIGAAVPELVRRGHTMQFVAAGPAVKLWRGEGREVVEFTGIEDFMSPAGLAADAVVVGTGFGGFERAAWQWARRSGPRSLAAIDSWTHLMRRFETPQGRDFPDVVAVIDTDLEAEFSAAVGSSVEIAVVGQPHLEAQTIRLRKTRAARRRENGGPALVFFSEPIIEDFGPHARGFDQFQVFETFARALGGSGAKTVSLTVKPHPREALDRWRTLVERMTRETAVPMALSGATAEKLLADADGAIGMTTMVLLEAHLAQVPLLSLQPGRTRVANPVIERVTDAIADAARLPAAVTAFLAQLGTVPRVTAELEAALHGAVARFADAVETRLLC